MIIIVNRIKWKKDPLEVGVDDAGIIVDQYIKSRRDGEACVGIHTINVSTETSVAIAIDCKHGLTKDRAIPKYENPTRE